ncbi:hypothetical protein [Nocardia blacklockiae]|uniref:hypothetical protein n=1 Tax=Nocardia blacklockiae TaxID=480036 RepID=UPI0018930F8E|nr:hypothetical protein [Nocardia blacklockiae]MBF6171201.1 hypothetical protein [Nocardia blacklockiae]
MTDRLRPRRARGATTHLAVRPASTRAPGYLRALGMLMLLVAVALMHAVVFAPAHVHAAAVGTDAHGHSSTDASHRASVTSDRSAESHSSAPAVRPAESFAAMVPAVAEPVSGTLAAPGCAACGDGHNGLHACVFVLAGLTLLLGLVLLAWVGVRRPGVLRVGARPGPFGGARSPPWTVLSLPELSILRI